MAITVGSDARLSWAVTPASGHTIASQVTLTILRPNGAKVSLTSSTIVNPTTDSYYADYSTLESGEFIAYWRSSGAVNHAERVQFEVEPSGV